MKRATMGTSSTPRRQAMLAGDVAKQLGIGVQTLHYYEREGLIPPPPRSGSGYRLFTPELVDRVRFIRKAQAIGLPLAEVKDIMRLTEEGSSPCARVHAALTDKLREVNGKLRELESFRDELASLIERAPALREDGASPHVCAIVEQSPPLQLARAMDAPLRARRSRTRAPRS